MAKQSKLTVKQYLATIAKVGYESFKMSPAAGAMQLGDSIMNAVLPIATTFFAAATTTALTEAYAGVPGAGNRAIFYVIITSLISIVMLAWGTVSSFILQKTRYRIEATVEDRMTSHFTALPFYMYDDKEIIDLHEKAKRFSTYFTYIFSTIGSIFSGLVSAIGAVVALTFVSPMLALVVLIAITPGVVIQVRLARNQARHWEGNITRRRRMYNIGYMLSESHWMAELRVYGVVKKLIAERAHLRDLDEKERLGIELRTNWQQLASSCGEALVELGALVWVTLQIIAHTQPVGQFLYVQQMVARAIGSTGGLGRQLGQVDQDLANIVHYQQFMELATEEKPSRKLRAVPKKITFNAISFIYPKTKKQVLADVSFEINEGQRVAIVGENGAGKSTLIKLLMGLYRPTEGKILVDGEDLASINPESWHSHIAVLSQEFVKYYFAVIRENITLGDITKTPTDAAIEEAVKHSQLDSVVRGLEHGLDTYIERWMAEGNGEATATELSGGQYQRLALARNLYRDAPIVILDEPTSAIDAAAEAKIFSWLFSRREKTIITISHRLSTIKKADVVYMFEEGKLFESGTADDLIAQRGKFYQMFESQL